VIITVTATGIKRVQKVKVSLAERSQTEEDRDLYHPLNNKTHHASTTWAAVGTSPSSWHLKLTFLCTKAAAQ